MGNSRLRQTVYEQKVQELTTSSLELVRHNEILSDHVFKQITYIEWLESCVEDLGGKVVGSRCFFIPRFEKDSVEN